MISSSMVMVITFALIGTLQFFTEPVVLRNIAQGAIDAAYTPNMYAYSLAFSYSQFNYASTIAFSLGIARLRRLVRLPLPHAQAERTQVMASSHTDADAARRTRTTVTGLPTREDRSASTGGAATAVAASDRTSS